MSEAFYTISNQNCLLQTNKILLGIFSRSDLNYFKIWSITLLNNQTVAVSGVSVIISVYSFWRMDGGVPVTVLKHDSSSPDIDQKLFYATSCGGHAYDLLRRVWWSTDEPFGPGVPSIDEYCTYPKIGEIYRVSKHQNKIQPWTLRKGEGIGIVILPGSTTPVGVIDIFVEISQVPL